MRLGGVQLGARPGVVAHAQRHRDEGVEDHRCQRDHDRPNEAEQERMKVGVHEGILCDLGSPELGQSGLWNSEPQVLAAAIEAGQGADPAGTQNPLM